ncbi:MAG: HD domain-containing protein [Patescibacteria group bacterium]
MSDIKKIFEFTTYIEGFKKLERFVGQTFWREYPQPHHYESNADHSWRMAMLLVVLEPRLAKPFDFKKAMTMLLIHDIPELIAGDPSPLGVSGTGEDSHAFNDVLAEEKFEREKSAAEIIFSKLPNVDAEALMTYWLEFENQSSYEARVVKALDKFEGKLQCIEYTKSVMFKTHYDFTMRYGVDTFAVDPTIKELGDILLNELDTNYKEFTPAEVV